MEIFLPVEVLTLEAFRHYLERVAYHHGTIAQADSPAALKQSSSRTNCFYCHGVSSQIRRFFRVWPSSESPRSTNHPAYFGLATIQ